MSPQLTRTTKNETKSGWAILDAITFIITVVYMVSVEAQMWTRDWLSKPVCAVNTPIYKILWQKWKMLQATEENLRQNECAH